MKLLMLSRYGSLGASSRLRSYQYLPYLTAQGMEITVSALLDDDYLRDLYTKRKTNWAQVASAYLRRLAHLREAKRFDLLWIEKELFPMVPALFEAILTHWGVPYVVDYDDAVFHTYDMHRNAWMRIMLGTKIDVVMRNATLVLAGNDYLASRARKVGARQVETVPTVIDLDKYPLPRPRLEQEPFTVGWIGTPVTMRYLALLQTPLRELVPAGTVRLVTIGSQAPEIAGVVCESRPWTENSEARHIQSFHVGVMPLHDQPFERGKCGYKLIQYMACGIPVVASPVGVNTEIVEHGVNGYLASSNEEWLEAFDRLRTSQPTRIAMGQAGRSKVERRYCLKVTGPRLYGLLKKAAERAFH